MSTVGYYTLGRIVTILKEMEGSVAKKQRRAAERETTVFMMNGLPGAMGHEVAAACLKAGFELAPYALTGTGMPSKVNVDGVAVALLPPSDGAAIDAAFVELKRRYAGRLVAIDFTHPTAVNVNAEAYIRHRVPFVMGTTGGDRKKLHADVGAAGLYAVIAANMCKQIVALQSMFETAAQTFPGAWAGYTLDITESHQSTKADTSGTAKDILRNLGLLCPGGGAGGGDFAVSDVKKLREVGAQRAWGVPEAHLNGHAFHTYTLTSADSSVQFQFKHNVCGRSTYANGVVDAVRFLVAQIKAAGGGEPGDGRPCGRIFNMIDVLRASYD